MIRETSTSGTINLFTNAENYLLESTKKQCNDDTEWFNQFRFHITNKIDEKIFFPLYCADNGAPISSIRINVAMIILKEAKGWSYDELREQCKANIFVRRAIGLFNLDDPIPARSTLFDFLARLSDWNKQNNDDLLEKLFKSITNRAVLEFSVMGNKVRMDSTMLGSNIAWLSRYELVHETLRFAYNREFLLINPILSEQDFSIIKEIIGEKGYKVTYRSTNSQLESKLISFGTLIYKIISNIPATSTEPIEILRKVFFEQYEIVDDKVVLLPKERLLSTNIQSPYDPDGDFNKKNNKKTKGYNVNVTETCNPDNFVNLITDVIVSKASVHDSKFLIPAIENTEEITGQKVETVNTDANYHSHDNQAECVQQEIDLVLSDLGGSKAKYDLMVDNNGDLIVKNLDTQEIIPSIKVNRQDLTAPPVWKIINENGKKRQFTQAEVDTSSLRRTIKNRSQAEINLRNNVEATISQLMYPFSNDKSVYRGLIRHIIWARARCLGINCRRITKFIIKLKKLLKTYLEILLITSKMRVLTSFLLNIFNYFCQFMRKFWFFGLKHFFSWILYKKRSIFVEI